MEIKQLLETYKQHVELTNLKSPASKDIQAFVKLAEEQKYFGVCLQYENIRVAAKTRTTGIKLVTVAGFPPISSFSLYKGKYHPSLNLYLGLYPVRVLDQVNSMCDDPNVDEIDLVFPMHWYAKGELVRIYKFFKGVKERSKKTVKVITELGTLFKNNINLFEIADLIEQSGVDYFKTNTGLIPLDFNLLMNGIRNVKHLKPNMKFKASGGIRTVSQVIQLLQLGVDRIGTSNLTNDLIPESKRNE